MKLYALSRQLGELGELGDIHRLGSRERSVSQAAMQCSLVDYVGASISIWNILSRLLRSSTPTSCVPYEASIIAF